MTRSKIIFATLLLGTLISSNAHALSVDQNLGTVSNTSGFVYQTFGPSNTLDYAASGILPSDSEIVFTYNANTPGGIALGAAGGNVVANASVTSFGGPQISPSAPVIAYANLGAGAASISIDNTTVSPESFEAMFNGFFSTGTPNSYTIGYAVSAVPLPASFLLFGTGLLALGAFAVSRKNRNSI